MKKEIIKTQMKVKENLVSVMRVGGIDYISLTDLARYKNHLRPVRNAFIVGGGAIAFYLSQELLENHVRVSRSKASKMRLHSTRPHKRIKRGIYLY